LDEVNRKIDEIIEDYKDLEMTKQVFIPGEDRTSELAIAEKALSRLRWESDNGIVDDEQAWQARMSSLSAKVRDLKAETIIPARWENVGTGKTYGELWNDPATDRRKMLKDAGFMVTLYTRAYEAGAARIDGPSAMVRIRIPDTWPDLSGITGTEEEPPEGNNPAVTEVAK
jgi:hypothetical protein